jgi:hypothetical protein
MAEQPALNRFYVASYAANDKDFPILAVRLDPRVAGYRVPEDLSPHPDSKRYPNHVFTGSQPSNGDERVTHIYEILPSPYVPFTRYDDDLGPIQGRRRSVKNEGQVAVLAADKRVTYEAREGSAIVYTEIEEEWSIETDEDGNSLFPIKDRDFYEPSRGAAQERRQLFVPTGEEEGTLENVNGVITQTSYEPYNEFLSVKVVQTYKVDGPQLVGQATDNDGQLVTVTTQRKGSDGYTPPNPTATRTVEVNSEDAESLVERIVDTPEIFTAQTFSVERPDPIPQKFRVAIPVQTTQEIVEGEAELPELSEGEISKSQQQQNKFLKRVSTTSRDQTVLPRTLLQKSTDNDRQTVTITETLQSGDTSEAPTATTTISSEALGDGNFVVTRTEIPEVFAGESFRKTKEDSTPQKFRAAQEDSTVEETIAGIADPNIVLEEGEFAKSEQQVNKFVKRVSTTSRAITEAKTLLEKVLTQDGQIAIRTLTLELGDQSFVPSALLVDANVEALGDGRTVKTETRVSNVFPRRIFRQVREDNTPAKFRAGLSRSIAESNVAGVATSPVLEEREIEKSEEQVNEFVKRVSLVKTPSATGVREIVVKNGGSGHNPLTTTITILPKDSKGSGAKASAVVENGKIVSVNIIDSGSGYSDGAIAVAQSNPAPTVKAELLVEIGLTIVEKELSQSGQIVTTISKIESEPTIQESPYTVRESFEQTNPNEFLKIKSTVGRVLPLSSITTSSPVQIPDSIKAIHGERIIEAETVGVASPAKLRPDLGYIESTDTETSLNKKRSRGRLYGKHSGGIVGVAVGSAGANYSQNTVIEVGGDGRGAVLKPIIVDGKLGSVEILNSGYGYFESGVPPVTIIDLEGTGSGAFISVSRDIPDGDPPPISVTSKVTNEEKQIAEVTQTLRGGDPEEPEEPSATVDYRTDNLGDGRFLVTKTEVPEVFGSKVFRKTKEDITPQKFKAAQEDLTTEQNVAGTANPDISLGTGEFAKSEQQVNKFVKRVSVTKRSTEETSSLVEKVLTPQGQLATRTLRLSKEGQEIQPNAFLIDGSIEALGDGRTIKTEVRVDDVFDEKQETIQKINTIPAKFRAAIPERTFSSVLQGTPPQITGLAQGEISKTLQRVGVDKFRETTTTQDPTPSAVLVSTEFTSELGGGIAQVFETYGEGLVSGTLNGNVIFGTVSDTTESLGDGKRVRRRVILNPASGGQIIGDGQSTTGETLPVLRGQEYDEELDIVIPFTQFVARAGGSDAEGLRKRVTPRDVVHSQVIKYDVQEAQEQLEEYFRIVPDMVEISLPPTLISASINGASTVGTVETDSTGETYMIKRSRRNSVGGSLSYVIEEGFRGLIPAERAIFFLSSENSSSAGVLAKVRDLGFDDVELWPNPRPRGHEVVIREESELEETSEAISFDSAATSTSTTTEYNIKSVSIPPTLHKTITIAPFESVGGSIVAEPSVLPETTSTRPMKNFGFGSISTGSDNGKFPTGRFIYRINSSPYRFTYTRVEVLIVNITDEYV